MKQIVIIGLMLCIASVGYCALNPDNEVTVLKEFKELAIGKGKPFLVMSGGDPNEIIGICGKDGKGVSEAEYLVQKAAYVVPKTLEEKIVDMQSEIALLKAR